MYSFIGNPKDVDLTVTDEHIKGSLREKKLLLLFIDNKVISQQNETRNGTRGNLL